LQSTLGVCANGSSLLGTGNLGLHLGISLLEVSSCTLVCGSGSSSSLSSMLGLCFAALVLGEGRVAVLGGDVSTSSPVVGLLGGSGGSTVVSCETVSSSSLGLLGSSQLLAQARPVTIRRVILGAVAERNDSCLTANQTKLVAQNVFLSAWLADKCIRSDVSG